MRQAVAGDLDALRCSPLPQAPRLSPPRRPAGPRDHQPTFFAKLGIAISPEGSGQRGAACVLKPSRPAVEPATKTGIIVAEAPKTAAFN